MITSDLFNNNKIVAEVSDKTLISYLQKVSDDSLKHDQDPSKRSAEKRNRSVSGFAQAFNKLDSRKPDGSVKEAEEDMPVHRIGLTVIDPQHPMVSKRREEYQKTVRVPGHDREQAITAAINHLRRRGYKVLDHHYMGLLEASLGDYRKKAQLSKAMAQTNRFFDRDDPEAVAQADRTIANRTKGLAAADARTRPYTPPEHDAEKYQRDLTAQYPNIDELVAKAEQRRDPNYDRAEGNAYYNGRDAEQNYQKLKQIQRVIQGLTESKIKENKMKLNEAILNEDPIYRTWKTLGQTLVERRMSEKEILQVFADAESGMTDKATGANRTMLGRGKDTTMDFAGQVKDAVSGVLNSIQNSVPVAAVDVAYDQATDALANLTGGQKGKVMQAIKGYRNLVKQYPKTAGFAKAALVAIAGLATGGAGLPAVAGLTYALDSSIRGDKLSSVIGKGAGAAFMTWLATQIGSANAADTKPVGPGYHDPVYDAPEITPDLATYTAKSGDTLSQIAKDNGTTVRDIVGLNPQLAAASGAKGGQMLNPDVIFPGQEITLPAAGGENIYSGGMGTNADTMAQIGRGNMPNSAITQRMAMRESLKFVTLPVDQLIDRELTAMSWVVNESMYNRKQRGVWLTQAGTYAVFENIDRYRLALMERAGVPGSTRPEYYAPDMPGGPGKASKPGMIGRGLNWLDKKAKAVGGALSNFGHQFTTDVTKEKLKMNWHQAGKPSDSDQLAAWLVTQGVPQPVVAGVFKKMNIPYTPNAEPQAVEPKATGPKTKELGTGTGEINPATGRPWTPSELKAKYQPQVAPAPTAPTPGPGPATTTPSGPPGFNAGNLAQLPGMAQYMQPKPAVAKPVANYGQAPAAYGKTTMNVGPAAAKTTAAAPAGKKPTAQQQQEYYKSLGLAEDLSWSQNFSPGRSLYRRMKQDI
jgi:LysM repeat protein